MINKWIFIYDMLANKCSTILVIEDEFENHEFAGTMPISNPAHVQETLFWYYNNTNVILLINIERLRVIYSKIEI